MKRTIMIVSLFGVLSSYIRAQEFSVHVHLAPPSTVFGGGDQEDFFGEIDYDDPYGFAGVGLGVGLEYHRPFGDKGVSGLVSVDLFRHGIKRSIRSQYRQQAEEDYAYYEWYDAYRIKFSAYYNVPILLGLHYDFMIKDIPLFVQGGAILDVLKVSNTKETYTDALGMVDYSFEKHAASFSLGYGIGAGVVLKDRYILGVGYKGLGVHSFRNSTVYESSEADTDVLNTDTVVKKIGMLNLTIGIQF